MGFNPVGSGILSRYPAARMNYLLALLPIAFVLILMTGGRVPGHWAGAAGWGLALVVGWSSFGLNGTVLWVSQAKGLLLSIFVLAVMWPALFVFYWHKQNGAIEVLVSDLRSFLPDPGFGALILAWALSGAFEGLAGFGLPIAIVSPMLVGLGVSPVRAVAAVAIGHSWSVTFGDMGIIFQTLVAITGAPDQAVMLWAGLFMGVACLGCGLGAALVLGQLRLWPAIVLIALVISSVQYALARFQLLPLSAFGAGLAGVLAAVLLKGQFEEFRLKRSSARRIFLSNYFGLALVLAFLSLVPVFNELARAFQWRPVFSQVRTDLGFVTVAGPGQVFRPFLHPGVLILLVSGAVLGWHYFRTPRDGHMSVAATQTWRSGVPVSVTVISMVGLASLMEHTGMTQLLARGAVSLLGKTFPLASPAVGMLGAFATGSNNNSNIMFGVMQEQIARLLQLSPALLVAAQSAGGSLGSLIAPAKIAVGCSTVGLQGQEGAVLKLTLPLGLVLGLLLGALALWWAQVA